MKYQQLIIENTALHLPARYDWRLVAAQIRQESNFKKDARSPVGAMGLMQVMPGTWEQMTQGNGNMNPDCPADNIHIGCKYMARRLKGWRAPRPNIDRICLALASYNAGFGHLLEAQKLAGGANDYANIIAALPQVTGRHAKETTQYVQRIYSYYNDYVIKGF